MGPAGNYLTHFVEPISSAEITAAVEGFLAVRR
jgi:hypothetical protein